MNTIKKLGTQLGIITLLGFILISNYFIISQYHNTKKQLKNDILHRLQAISTTVSFQINGDEHKALLNKYSQKNAITSSTQDSIYHTIHCILKQCKEANNIKTDIYTLYYDQNQEEKPVQFGVTSGNLPYYKHDYINYPKELIKYYQKGSLINLYEDNHGTWLSAFAPIKTSSGEVVGVVQVDQQFDEFLAIVRKRTTQSIIISSLVAILISLIVFYFIFQLVKQDQKKTTELGIAYDTVSFQKTRIQDSINYAKKIQSAIIPDFNIMKLNGIKTSMIYRPKDVVSGDLPWAIQANNKVYISAIDSTGHGVPGAMISFVGYFLLNQIINRPHLSPADVLCHLDIMIRETLRQEDQNGSNDGMDLGLLVIDYPNNEITFSGAKRPLYQLSEDGHVQVHKGTSKSIGGRQLAILKNRKFETIQLNLTPGDRFFLFTDGFPDQFNESDERKFSAKRIRKILESSAEHNLQKSIQILEEELDNWQKKSPQTDDILFVGIEV